MSKYQRYQAAIIRNSDENFSEDHWLKQFEKNLQKDAVQPKSQQSLFDQINTIMNRTSKHTSVEAAVADMKERSGLTAYLKNAEIEATEKSNVTKQASDDKSNKKMPVVIQKFPGILITLENCIRDSKGNLPIPAIIERIKSIHHNDVSDEKDWEQDDLMYLVSQLNLDAKKNNPTNYDNYHNLGSRDSSNAEIDPSNMDAFFGLNPAR